MKTLFRFFSLIALTIAFTSCSHVLVGTWNVVRYETVDENNQAIILNNIGTMTFEKDGYGNKSINYSIFGRTKEDNTSFLWNATKKFVNLSSSDSDLSKTWIVVESKRNSQLWKATDGETQVQILELSK